jgi:hypothetical protein
MHPVFVAPTRRAAQLALGAVVASLVAVSCATASTPPPTATPVPATQPAPTRTAAASASASPSQSPVVASPSSRPITLRQAPDNLGCDAIGVNYTRMTFRIDPNAAEQVVAVTDTNVQLLTNWSAGFRQAPGGQRAIVDPSGTTVATDGQVLAKASSSATRLGGYFVCLGPAQIYVLLRDPS